MARSFNYDQANQLKKTFQKTYAAPGKSAALSYTFESLHRKSGTDC